MRKTIQKHICKQLIWEQILSEAAIKIPRIKLSGNFYHGTVLVNDDNLFYRFDSKNSDWNAIWFADDEYIAEEYSDWKGGYGDGFSEIRVVYRVGVNIRSIADISYELSQEIKFEWELEDFREAIDILREKGFKGWQVPGSLGHNIYNDIAIFYPDEIKIQDVKLYLNDEWTDYMSIDEAQTKIDEIREEKESLNELFENISNSDSITLYHGTSKESANEFLKNGWSPRKEGAGANFGNPKYLYLTSEPEDALWFAQEKGEDTIVKVSNIPLSYLKPDPEDEAGFTMKELLDRIKNSNSPSKFALFQPLDSSHFQAFS